MSQLQKFPKIVFALSLIFFQEDEAHPHGPEFHIHDAFLHYKMYILTMPTELMNVKLAPPELGPSSLLMSFYTFVNYPS